MTATHWLVTDTTAEELEQRLGLRGHNTPLGVLVDRPKPFNLESELDKLDRILHPNKMRCTCGKQAIIHHGNCPFVYAIT